MAKMSYTQKVEKLRESMKKDFMQVSLTSNQYGMPRPGLLDMRGSGVTVEGFPVLCVTALYLVIETENKNELGWVDFGKMNADDQADYLDKVSKWRKEERIVKYDPFISADQLNDHIRAVLGM